MRILWQNKWLMPLLLFLVHQLMQKVLHIPIYLMDHYLDPFCLGALGLYGVRRERKWLFGQSELSKIDILVVTIFLAVVSEVLFPFLSHAFVSDVKDVISLGLGAGWFVIIEHKSHGTIQKSL